MSAIFLIALIFAPFTLFVGALIVGGITGGKHGIKIKGIINDKF